MRQHKFQSEMVYGVNDMKWFINVLKNSPNIMPFTEIQKSRNVLSSSTKDKKFHKGLLEMRIVLVHKFIQ